VAMAKDQVKEILQWMHLAMGTNAETAISDDSKAISSVLEKLQQLKSDLESSKNKAERYKRELGLSAFNFTTKLNLRVHNLENELEMKKSEIDRYKDELKFSTSNFNKELKLKDEKIEQLAKDLALSKGEVVHCKRKLEASQLSFLSLKNELIDQIVSTLSDSQSDSIKKINNDLKNEIVRSVEMKMGDVEKRMGSFVKNHQTLTNLVKEGNKRPRAFTIPNIFETTLRASFNEMTQLPKLGPFFSDPIFIAGVEWAISIAVYDGRRNKYLSMNLNVVSKKIPAMWSCAVRMTMHVLSQNGYESETELIDEALNFTAEKKIHGSKRFITFLDLLKPFNGFVKDNSIKVAIEAMFFPS
ncbi:hypothetical protein PFISCL1PPCAC_20283, partial [Pristionchus fissidentatus]